MTTELLPCPFCGDDQPALDHEADTGAWSVRCTHCGITIGNYAGERSALSAWSRRTSPTTPTEGPAQPDQKLTQAIDRLKAQIGWLTQGTLSDDVPMMSVTDMEVLLAAIEGPAQTLTDEEIEELWSAWVCGPSDAISTFARAVESKVRAGTLTDPEGAS